jgi:hypothetical protein
MYTKIHKSHKIAQLKTNKQGKNKSTESYANSDRHIADSDRHMQV